MTSSTQAKRHIPFCFYYSNIKLCAAASVFIFPPELAWGSRINKYFPCLKKPAPTSQVVLGRGGRLNKLCQINSWQILYEALAFSLSPLSDHILIYIYIGIPPSIFCRKSCLTHLHVNNLIPDERLQEHTHQPNQSILLREWETKSIKWEG